MLKIINSVKKMKIVPQANAKTKNVKVFNNNKKNVMKMQVYFADRATFAIN